MKSPFPGMDPYLESARRWRGFHLRLLNYIAADLQPQLLPKYIAALEERIVVGPSAVEMWPDVQIRDREETRGGLATIARVTDEEVAVPECIAAADLLLPHRYVNIRDRETEEVITALELLSPWNKTGRGREKYQRKQERLIVSGVNLVEIDLLRRGPHALAIPEPLLKPSAYCVCVYRAAAERFEVVRFGVRDPLPNVAVPLREEDRDVVLHMGSAFDAAYEVGAYAYDIRYSEQPENPLPAEDAAWAREQTRDR